MKARLPLNAAIPMVQALGIKLLWIAGGTAVSRGAVAFALLAASTILPLSEYGLLGVYLSIALMSTQTVGYSVALFILKSSSGFFQERLRALRFVISFSFVSALIFLVLCATFIQKHHTSFMLGFFLYVLLSCANQCMVAFHQGVGNFRKPTIVSSAVITLAALLSIGVGWLFGGACLILTISTGFLVSALWLGCEVKFPNQSTKEQNYHGGLAIFSEIAAISASGLMWGGLASWLISGLATSAGLDSAAYYAFGAQFRAALIFIPGVIGVYLTSRWAHGLAIGEHKRRALWLAASASASAVSLLGVLAFLALLIFNRTAGLKALDIPVVAVSLAASVVVAGSTPVLRWISVHYGDWWNAVITFISVFTAVAFAQAAEATAVWRTIAFLIAYLVQASSSVVLCLIKERSKRESINI